MFLGEEGLDVGGVRKVSMTLTLHISKHAVTLLPLVTSVVNMSAVFVYVYLCDFTFLKQLC